MNCKQREKFCCIKHAWLMLLMLFCVLNSSLVFAEEGEGQGGATVIEPSKQDYILAEEDVEEAVKRFTKRASEFQSDISGTVEENYKSRSEFIDRKYEGELRKFESQEITVILSAIEKFESFVKRFPSEKEYTPDAMFRLAELYYQKARHEFNTDRERFVRDYEKRLQMFDEGLIDYEPKAPHPDFDNSLKYYNIITRKFPSYRYIADVYYLMAYCYQEEGDLPKVRRSFEDLIASRPDSKYVAEAYLRIGDAYFNENNYEPALQALLRAATYQDSALYDQILYKLASTYFILNRFTEAVQTFARLNDYSEELLLKKKRHSYFRDESVKYIAFCYAQSDDYWQGAGVGNAIRFFDKYGEPKWEADVFRDLGDYFYQQSKWQEAVIAYKRVLNKDPWDQDNPKLQMKIISIYLRGIKDDKQMNIERERLIEDFGEESAWAMQNADNPEAVEEATNLALDSLKQWAYFLHMQAYQYRQSGNEKEAQSFYKKAARAYKRFLKRFPHDKEAYELNFRLAEARFYSGNYKSAAKTYLSVRDSKLSKKYFQIAAYQLVLCYWNRILQNEGQLTQSEEEVEEQQRERMKGKVAKKKIPEPKMKYIEASDFYVANVKDPEDKEGLAWNSAEIYFEYNELETARERYIDIVNKFPKSEFALRAAERIIDTYKIVEDWVKVTEWSERMAALEIGGTEEREQMRARLKFVKGNAMAMYAMELEQRKEWEKAADQYLKAVAMDPKGKDAPKMIYNAAIDYGNAKRPAKAMVLFQRIVDDYPQAEFASESLYYVAESAYDAFNLNKASQAYAKLYTEYPDTDKKRICLAIYNHAQLEEFNHAYRKAAGIYEKYVKECGDVDKNAPLILFRSGEIYEKLGDWRRMDRIYQSFIDRYGKTEGNQRFAIQAYVRMADAYEKRGRSRDAVKYYQKAIDFFKSMPVLETDALANELTAKAEFTLVELEFEKYKQEKITGRNQEQLAESFKKKEARMLEVVELYTKIKNYRSPEYFFAASVRSAECIEVYANALFDAPVLIPKEIKRAGADYVEEFRLQYEQTMYDLATPYYKKAADMYLEAMENARKAKLYSSIWMKRLFQALNRPNVKPHVMGDIVLRKPELPKFKDDVVLPLPLDTGKEHQQVREQVAEDVTTELREVEEEEAEVDEKVVEKPVEPVDTQNSGNQVEQDKTSEESVEEKAEETKEPEEVQQVELPPAVDE